MWNFKQRDIPVANIFVQSGENWRNVKPGDWHRFAGREELLTKDTVTEMSSGWERLMTENASLRVLEHGRIKSVDETYYDDLILETAREMQQPFQENWLIGSLQEKEPELPDYWFYTRIEAMISEGRFVVKKASDAGWPASWKVLGLV